jgi:hypothetical protein
MKRLTELDVLRGILLLMMVVNHSPSSLRRFTDQPIGFFSTAEAFVFVSAFLAGMLFRKRIEKNGFHAARSSTIHRAGRIYCAHLLTLAVAFVIGSFLLSYLPGLRTLFEQYLKNPPAAIGASMLLVFQPPLMDILPMYILFSLLTPFVFWAAGRWGWKTVIFSSLSIWLIGQLRVRDLLVTATKDLSYINPGPFDVLAWQFLWVVGLFCGQRLCEKKRALPLPKPLPVILILVSIAFFAWRLITVSAIAVPTNQAWLLDKWHLGPLRLLNFLVTGWAFSKVLGHLQCWETVLHPFSLIGRNMLPVFCSQIGLSMLLIGIIPFFRGAEPVSSILVICQLLTAFLFARFVEWLTQKKKLLGESTEHFAANHRTLANVQTPALSAWMNQWSAFAAATKVERLSTPVAPASVTPASLSLASAPRRHLPFPGAGQVSKWKCGNFAGTP